MSIKPILNDPEALNNKSLDLFCDELTANKINGEELDLTNINCETLSATTQITTPQGDIDNINTININGNPETNFVLTDGTRNIINKQIIAQPVYYTRSILANGENPAFNIITDIDGTAQRQIFLETTTAETDGATIDRISYTGDGSELPVIDIYVKLATLKVVHNQTNLNGNEYPIQCPDNVGFQIVNDFTTQKYGWVRLFFWSGGGYWLLSQIN